MVILSTVLFSACGQVEDPEQSTGESLSSDPVTETTETTETPTVSYDGFVLDVELPEAYPESARVISAQRLAFDASSILAATEDENYGEKTVLEGAGLAYRDFRDGGFYFALSSLDGNFGDEDRRSTGALSFSFVSDEDVSMGMVLTNLGSDLCSFSTSARRTAESFEAVPDSNEAAALLSLADKYEGVFEKMGVNLQSLLTEKTCLVPSADQAHLGKDLVGELPEDQFTEGSLLSWRQYFDGIPVNRYPWETRINQQNNSGLTQQITAYENGAGTYGFNIRNVMIPVDSSEEKPVVSCESVMSDLNDRLLSLFSDEVYYLAEIELCYLIYEAGEEDFVLYPAWILIVDSVGETMVEDETVSVRRTDERLIFTYDAFTGELIQTVDVPKY